MPACNRLSRILCAFILALMLFPASAQAVALLSEKLTLYLPWVNFQGISYTASLKSADGDTLLTLQLDELKQRQPATLQKDSVLVDTDLTISVPQLSYRGELFSVTLRHNGADVFQVADASPVVINKNRGNLLSITLMESKTSDQIAAEYPLAVIAGLNLRYDVALYRIGYQTQDALGNLTAASGVIGVPLNIPAGAPLLSFQHGTISKRDQAPSIDPAETGADLVLYLMAARGYLVTVADYLGYGDNTGTHPFMHAKTLAWSVIDLIRAVRTLAATSDYPLNGQLFLTGYSEGGYATMAAQRELETHHADEFTITASAPMAGAYDMSGTMLQQVLSSEQLARPELFIYVLLAYNAIYGFDDNLANLLTTDVAVNVESLFDGLRDTAAINAALPSLISDLFAPGLLTALRNGDDHPLRSALGNNDVYRWTPVSPTRLYHCRDDEVVPFANSTVAHNYFIAAGAEVKLETLFFGNHVDCAVPALLGGSNWFDTLVSLP